jgi:prepilin-type processing-associated H-X9-DG protein
MPISYSCPHCGKQFSVADQYAGQSGPCAACGQTITIPGPLPAQAYYYAPKPSSGVGGGVIALIVVLAALVLLCPCGVALLLPAVQAAREAARRASSANNLKQIGIALHNYHNVYGSFPPAVVLDKDGKPLYSGRVLLLPFLEQQPLYDQFDKTQAWDSPANLTYSQSPLKVFVDPSCPTQQPGKNNYEFVIGQGAMFEQGQQIKLSDITDGTANTIAIIEVRSTGQSWAAPSGVEVGQLAAGLPQGNHPGGSQVLMADGSVRFFSQKINPQLLHSLGTRAGMEPVNPP